MIDHFGIDDSAALSPMDDSAKVLRLWAADGAQVVFNTAKAQYWTSDGKRSETFDVIGHVRLRQGRHEMSIWFGPRQMSSPVAFNIEGEDVLGDKYLIQFRVQSQLHGGAVTAVHGTVLFLRGVREIKIHENKKYNSISMPLPIGIAFPFSSVTQIERKAGARVLRREGFMDGFYGFYGDTHIDIRGRDENNRLDVTTDQQAEPEKLVEATEYAASYALGVMIDPEYVCVQIKEKRTVFVRPQEPRKSIDQSASLVDKRLGGQTIALLFGKVFHSCLRNTGTLLPKEIGLFVDVYRTFEGGYLSLQLLHICIAIEALLRVDATLSAEDRFDKADRQRISAALDAAGLADAKRSRVSALLSQLNAPSIMYLFDREIAAGKLQIAHKEAFKRHRSILAHGGSIEGNAPTLKVDRVVLLSAFHALFIRRLDALLMAQSGSQDFSGSDPD